MWTTVRVAALFSVVLLGATASLDAQKQLLYALDFDDHVVGQLPGIGAQPAPCRVVSDVLFGDPTVVAHHGPLLEQPLQFGNGTTGYDQILVNVDDYIYANRPPYRSYERFHCEMDLVISNLTNRFTLHFSGTSVYSIWFDPSGAVFAWTTQGSVPLGSYTPGALLHLRLDFDLQSALKTLQVTMNGVAAPVLNVYGLNLNPPRLRRIRWNLDGADASESVGIDNVKIFGAGGTPAIGLGYASERGADLSLHTDGTSSLDVHCATPGWPVALILSNSMQPVAVLGGTLVPSLAAGYSVTVVADADGSYWETVPPTAQPVTRYLQAAHLDLPSLEVVFSNAIQEDL